MSPLGTSTTPPSSTRTGSAYAGFSTTRTGQAMLPAACEGTPEAHCRVAPDAIPAWHHTGLRAGRAFACADPSSQQPRTPTPRCGVSQLGADGDHIDAQLQGFHGRAEARGPTPDDSKGGAFDVGSSGPGGGGGRSPGGGGGPPGGGGGGRPGGGSGGVPGGGGGGGPGGGGGGGGGPARGWRSWRPCSVWSSATTVCVMFVLRSSICFVLSITVML
jgi:hypothetical protein